MQSDEEEPNEEEMYEEPKEEDNPILDSNRKKLEALNVNACRICLGDDNEEENPLISPCSCIGSLQFIHA